MALSHGGKEPLGVTDGLALYFDAANVRSYPKSGSTWFDRSGNNNNAGFAGCTYNSANSGSIVLNAIGDYIVLPDLSPYLANKTKFSFSMFVKITSSGSVLATLFSYGNYALFSTDIVFYYSPADLTLNFQINNGADGGAGFAYTIGSWSHISVVYDGTQSTNDTKLKVYLNSILQTLNFNTYTVPATTANAAYSSAIGAYTAASNGAHTLLGGNISQVSLYNKALSATEVSQNFNAFRGRFAL